MVAKAAQLTINRVKRSQTWLIVTCTSEWANLRPQYAQAEYRCIGSVCVERPYHHHNGIKKRGLLPKMIVVIRNTLNVAGKYAP